MYCCIRYLVELELSHPSHGLVQHRRISIVLSMEILQSYTKLLAYT